MSPIRLFFVFLIAFSTLFSFPASSLLSPSFLFAATLTVTEGDLIKLQPKASDPDQDKLFFTYSPPLNASGQWQTTLNDAGTYHTKLIASDGRSQTEEELTLIVQNKNQPPHIEKKKIIAEETETVDLKPLLSDPDNDTLKMLFQPPFNEQGLWPTTYNDSGLYQTQLTISDLEYKATETLEIEVKNKNRPPQLLSSYPEETPFRLTEDTTTPLSVSAQDPDNNPLSYSWLLDSRKISSQPSFDYYFDFASSGSHVLALTVSDQESEVQKNWTLQVENVNRAPEIIQPDILVDEGEKITLLLPETDADGDSIAYNFSSPLQPDGTWQTTYADAGVYTALLTATDGELTDQKELKLTIKNVDRPPQISLDNKNKGINLEKIVLNEKEELSLNLADFASDPDGDSFTLSLSNLPPGASFLDNQLSWQPDYTFVQRKVNFFTDFLARLKIEKYLLPPRKKLSLPFTACAQELCTSASILIQVNNVNRPPVLADLADLDSLNPTEAETLRLLPLLQASDPDQDYLTYSFEKPFNSQGEWTPGYQFVAGDQPLSEFFTNITVSDGELADQEILKITVLNQNRPPSFRLKKDYYQIKENQTLSFSLSALDPDNDSLALSLEAPPSGASFQDLVFTWTPSFDFAQKNSSPTYTLNFTASDSEFKVIHPVYITVKDVNRPPELLDFFPAPKVTAPSNQPITFFASFDDPDQDNLTYTWSFGPWDKEVSGFPALKRTFKSPGFKTVRLTASDGTFSVEKEWLVKVNPPPALPKAPTPPVTPSAPAASLSAPAAPPSAPAPLSPPKSAPSELKSPLVSPASPSAPSLTPSPVSPPPVSSVPSSPSPQPQPVISPPKSALSPSTPPSPVSSPSASPSLPPTSALPSPQPSSAPAPSFSQFKVYIVE